MKSLLRKLGLISRKKPSAADGSKVAELRGRLKARDSRIAELRGRLKARDSRIAELNAGMAALIAEKGMPGTGGVVLHAIATKPFGRAHPVASEIMAGVLGISDARAILAYRFIRGAGLEIGALHFPLPLPPGASAKYYDYRSTAESRRLFRDLPADKIVEVDFVGDGEKLDLVADESLDFLVANHMLEHCQDVIGTLRIFYGKLKQEGVLFISLPDLRYTFDHRRQPTPFEHLVRDHREGPGVSLYEHYRELQGAWSGKHLEGLQAFVGAAEAGEVVDRGQFDKGTAGKHVDWHFHAWTQSEILEMFTRLGREHGFVWEIEAAMRNGIEVIVVLRKTTVRRYDRNEDAVTTAAASSGAEPAPAGPDPKAQESASNRYCPFRDDTDDPIVNVEETWLTDSGIDMRGWVASRGEKLPEVEFQVAGCTAEVRWSERPDLAALAPDCPPASRRGFSFHVSRRHVFETELVVREGGRARARTLVVPATGRTVWPCPPGPEFREFIERVDRPGSRVLEIGSRLVSPGAVSKRSSFQHAQYVGFDYHPDGNTDVVGDAHALTRHFEGEERFDGIFSGAVLEHLAMPWAAVLEMNRLLKPGGWVYHAVPFAWPWHEAPWDFWRFSHHGLEVLFSRPLGFEPVKSGMSGSARIVPDQVHPGLEEFWCHPAYLGSQVLARKIADADPDRFRWDAALADVVEGGSSYPLRQAAS